MSDENPTAEEYQEEYNSVVEEYGLSTWLDNTEENWEAVQKLDPHLVWTNHSTCEDEMLTNGCYMFKNSCCWETYGWLIGSTPWEGNSEDSYLAVKASAQLPCSVCNLNGEDEEIDEECQTCEGDGYVQFYFD
jgi:hypothetical protein